MADRYWVGGTGNWDTVTTTHWSASSGGAGGASVPTSSDNVIFDSGSNNASYNPTIIDVVSCLNIDFTNPSSGTLTFTLPAGANSLNVFGSWTVHSNIILLGASSNAILNFKATATGKTITTNGIAFPDSTIDFNGVGGGWTLQDNVTHNGSHQMNVTKGAFDTGNKNISTPGFNSDNVNTRTVTLGTSTITVTTALGCQFSQTTGLTFSGASSTITLSTGNGGFSGGGLTWGTVNINGNGSNIIVTGSNTISALSISAANGKIVKFTAGTTQTVTTFTASGTDQNILTLKSSSNGSTWTISKSSGTVNCNFLSLQDSTASGGATFNAGINSTDVSNNSGWVFATKPTSGLLYFI